MDKNNEVPRPCLSEQVRGPEDGPAQSSLWAKKRPGERATLALVRGGLASSLEGCGSFTTETDREGEN